MIIVELINGECYQLPLDQGNDMSHENPSVGSVSEEPANAEPSKASSLT